ncbi:hypothetical protein AKJ38_02915 [candidate division MSBL1 archaeon SCGC-AAA259I14]|uniref:Uncharacterized protein n=1 Tax=candidate division MSBL1 archaeon SCGC-AAA259I14 TaxID=1698268 RepID=A0A133URA9_9EURY|nr:hypothetical protein AKJ38_02915 [candidate division MSBL1 archaeon SCGC-AAA259I14]
MVKEAAGAVRNHIKEGETAVFRLVSHKLLGDAKAYVVVVNRYGVESMTLEEAENMIRERMNPLKQGVKRTTS